MIELAYLNETKEKVEDFIKKRDVVFQTEVQYLGSKKLKIMHSTVKEILCDLEKEKKIRINKVVVGGNVFFRISWVMKK